MGEPVTDRVRFHLREILPPTGGLNRDQLREAWVAYQARFQQEPGMLADISRVRLVIDTFISSEGDFLSVATLGAVGSSPTLLERVDINTESFGSRIITMHSTLRVRASEQPSQFHPAHPSFYLTQAALGAADRSIGDYSPTFYLGGDRDTVGAFYRVVSGGSTHHYRLLVRRTLPSGRVEFTDFHLTETAMRAALSQIEGTPVDATLHNFRSLTEFVADKFRLDTSLIVALNHSPARGFVQIGSLARGQAWYKRAYTGSSSPYTTNFLNLASAISAIPSGWSDIVNEHGAPTWARFQGTVTIPGISSTVSVTALSGSAAPSDLRAYIREVHSHYHHCNQPTTTTDPPLSHRDSSIRILTQFTVTNPHQGGRVERRQVYAGRFNGINYFHVVSWHGTPPAFRICSFRVPDLPSVAGFDFSSIPFSTDSSIDITSDMEERLQIFFGLHSSVEQALQTSGGVGGRTFTQVRNDLAGLYSAGSSIPLRAESEIRTTRVR